MPLAYGLMRIFNSQPGFPAKGPWLRVLWEKISRFFKYKDDRRTDPVKCVFFLVPHWCRTYWFLSLASEKAENTLKINELQIPRDLA